MAPILDSAFNCMSTVEEAVKQFKYQHIVTLDRSEVRTILALAFLCNVPDHHLAKDSSINFNRCKSTSTFLKIKNFANDFCTLLYSLYSSFGRSPTNKLEKLKCLVSYFGTAFSPEFEAVGK